MIPNIKVLMFSSGRTSAFLARYYKERHGFDKYVGVYLGKGKPAFHYHTNNKGEKLIIMMLNTGKERKESLNFANKCDKEWDLKIIYLEADIINLKGISTGFNIVEYKYLSTDGKPFEKMLKKYPMPHNRGVSNCTRELKERPKEKFMKRFFGKNYFTIVGIRKDEEHRKSVHAVDKNILYPLCDEIDFIVDSKFIRSWWDNQKFDLELKDYEGNCDLCFKKSLKKRLTLISENPNIATWWMEMEDKHSDTYDIDGIEYRRYFDMRSNISISDLIKMAKMPFTKAEDLHLLSQQQKELFEIESDCFCKAN